MKILLKEALILAPKSKWNNQKKDILISDGIIEKIGTSILAKTDKVIRSGNLMVSAGWFDMSASFGEPGHEHREDLNSGLEAAKRGGFTGIGLNPDTVPPVDSKGQVEFVLSKTKNHHVKLYPYGTISKGAEGDQLAEMFDMNQAGAIAFTDNKSIDNSELMKLALMYIKNIDAPILSSSIDRSLSMGGQMNEGDQSTALGMKGIPELAEVVRTERDLRIAEYSETSLHFNKLSSPEAIENVARSKNGHTCSIPIANLVWDDSILAEFDTNFKLMPPLRSKNSVKKLRKLIQNGGAEVIVSAHLPQDIESKRCEFEYAQFGMATLEVFFKLLLQAFGNDFKNDNVIESITNSPRRILGLEEVHIEKGAKAELSIFDPDEDFVITKEALASKAINYPLEHLQKKGKVIGSINGRKLYLA